jgi:hypothetical protein
MKKPVSIFLLFLFFLFQYGKMLDYMECRIAAAIEAKEDCGCDNKLTGNTTDDSVPAPFHQHQLKNYTEEFFDHSFTVTAIIMVSNQQQSIMLHAAAELPGYTNGILQPPQI